MYLWGQPADSDEHHLLYGPGGFKDTSYYVIEFVQVWRHHFGNLQAVSGVDPSLQFTFYSQAETVKAVANGPLRIIDRTGTTTTVRGSM